MKADQRGKGKEEVIVTRYETIVLCVKRPLNAELSTSRQWICVMSKANSLLRYFSRCQWAFKVRLESNLSQKKLKANMHQLMAASKQAKKWVEHKGKVWSGYKVCLEREGIKIGILRSQKTQEQKDKWIKTRWDLFEKLLKEAKV